MKKFISILLLLVLSAGISTKATNALSLFEAVKNKMVTVTLAGRGYSVENGTSHYGKCISLEIKNLTSQSLELKVEVGRRLKCVYDSIQDMMISRSEMFALAPYAKYDYTINAFCTQKHDRAPGETSFYDLSSMSEGYLFQLAQLIESLDCQNNTGQQAVWVLTDSISPNDITGADASKVKKLKDFVEFALASSKKQGISGMMYDYSFPDKTTAGFAIKGEINWNMPYTSFVTITIYDNQNNKVAILFAEKPYKTGFQTYNYDLTNTAFKEGELYWLRVEGCGKRLKELAIKME
ncbi:MAG: hypothetical protein WCQ95_03285 [Bacteroidota bacterium]